MKPADKAPGGGGGKKGRGRRCPLCGKPEAHDFRPFCSRRCADIDLGRWLRGTYAIPGEADAGEDEDGGVGGGE
jgi:endogenous inhibitor of DNA gyrase (YacG/DUF329 family)